LTTREKKEHALRVNAGVCKGCPGTLLREKMAAEEYRAEK